MTKSPVFDFRVPPILREKRRRRKKKKETRKYPVDVVVVVFEVFEMRSAIESCDGERWIRSTRIYQLGR